MIQSAISATVPLSVPLTSSSATNAMVVMAVAAMGNARSLVRIAPTSRQQVANPIDHHTMAGCSQNGAEVTEALQSIALSEAMPITTSM